jgi:hypothetical protein
VVLRDVEVQNDIFHGTGNEFGFGQFAARNSPDIILDRGVLLVEHQRDLSTECFVGLGITAGWQHPAVLL